MSYTPRFPRSNKKLSLLIAIIICASGISALLLARPSQAIAWNAGNIIDDVIFTNSNTMSPESIQSFLNSKVPVCDTNGTQTSEYGGGTRAQWGQAHYGQSTFICLKDYSEGGRSSAQIIYDTAQKYQINPQVLIVLLQKEQGLVTDTWPLNIQYRTATGYGCPDTAPCDAQYYGLTNQLDWSGKMFRSILNNSPTWYTPYVLGNNYIQYNPSASCGGSTVDIQNRATQALYNYTPYQPNQAALDAGWGTAPCGAYGNRNFVLYFNDWFGSTTNSRLNYQLIRSDASADVYLQTSAGKYYVPSYSLLSEWGMGPNDLKVMSQAYLNNIPSKGTLSNTLTDGYGNLYVVEGSKIHQVLSPNHTAAWGVDTSNIVESLGLTYTLSKKEPLNRFVTQSGGDGSIWLVDGNKRHLVSGSMLYSWGYYPGAANVVSNNMFSRYTEDTAATQFASANGTIAWAIDASAKRPFKDAVTQRAYIGDQTATNVNGGVLGLMNQGGVVTRFSVDTGTGQWFMADGGVQHYIPRGELVGLWGKPSGEGMTLLTNNFQKNVPDSNSLGYTARAETSGAYWLIATQKHSIPSASVNIALTGSDTSPAVYSDELIDSIPTGAVATTSVLGDSTPYNYKYFLDQGYRRHPSNQSAEKAWAPTPNTLTVPSDLLRLIPEGSFIGNIVRKSNGVYYFVESGKSHVIPSDFVLNWTASSTMPVLSDASIDSFTASAPLTDFTHSTSGDYYIVSGGKKQKLDRYRDTYPVDSMSAVTLDMDGVGTGNSATYLAQSTNSLDSRRWLINKGTKKQINFEQLVTLGYLSRSVALTSISPTTLGTIPDSTTELGLLIQKTGSGIKFLNFGSSLGFPDGLTLVSYVNTNSGITLVSDSIYDSFLLDGNISRLIRDDSGRYWWVSGGKKQYVTSWLAFYNNSLPTTTSRYLYGTTMNLLETANDIK